MRRVVVLALGLALGLAPAAALADAYQYGDQFPPAAPGVDRVAGPHAVVWTSGKDFKYDANGNLVCRKVAAAHVPDRSCAGAEATFTHGPDNKLRAVADGAVTAEYFYGPSGERAASVVGARRTHSFGAAYEVVDGAPRKQYLVGGRRIAYAEGSALRYVLADHLGSVARVVDAARQPVQTRDYYPFGEELLAVGEAGDRRRFNGREVDETGLYDYGARSYQPALGHFIQADSIVPDGARPQTLNRYAYVENNPVRYVDPTGHAGGDFGAFQSASAEHTSAPQSPDPLVAAFASLRTGSQPEVFVDYAGQSQVNPYYLDSYDTDPGLLDPITLVAGGVAGRLAAAGASQIAGDSRLGASLFNRLARSRFGGGFSSGAYGSYTALLGGRAGIGVKFGRLTSNEIASARSAGRLGIGPRVFFSHRYANERGFIVMEHMESSLGEQLHFLRSLSLDQRQAMIGSFMSRAGEFNARTGMWGDWIYEMGGTSFTNLGNLAVNRGELMLVDFGLTGPGGFPAAAVRGALGGLLRTGP